MTLGGRIRQWMTMNRMPAKAFCTHFGIPYRTLYGYLSDKRKPSAEHLASMSEGGICLDWLLTGKVRAQLVFDLSRAINMRPVSGVVLADPELSRLLLGHVIDLVDRHARANPQVAAGLGLGGLIAQTWHLYTHLAATADQFADRFEQARRDGWGVQRLADMITSTLDGRELSVIDPDKSSAAD